VVWRWGGEPFGASRPDEDPDHNHRRFRFNLRFPGQYFDRETGLNNNYFRDYDPRTGRYVESDPSGLRGGLNTYGYVASDPLFDIDIRGLSAGSCAEDKPHAGANLPACDTLKGVKKCQCEYLIDLTECGAEPGFCRYRAYLKYSACVGAQGRPQMPPPQHGSRRKSKHGTP